MASRTPKLRRGFPKPLFLALTLAVLLLVPASSFGAGWVNFSPVSGDPGGGRTVAQPKLAADSAGNQVAVWIEQPSPFKVVAAFRPAGGAWGAAQVLDSLATTAPNTDLAVDAGGNFIVLYSEVVGTTYKVFARYLPAGQSTLGAAEQLGPTLVGTPTITAPTVAFDGTGRAWGAYGIAGQTMYAGRRPAGPGAAWTVINTSLPTNSTVPDIAVTGAGEATIADVPSIGGVARYWRLLAGGTQWTQLTSPAAVGNVSGAPIIRVDGSGRTTTMHLVAQTNTQVATQTCPPGTGACAARVTLAQLGTNNAANPALAVDSAGNAIASWNECIGALTCVPAVAVARRVGSTGAFGGPVQIGSGTTPAQIFDSTGAAMAVFSDTTNRINFALAAAGSALGPPASTVTDPAQSWAQPRLASDGNGNIFGAWSGAGIQSAVYDSQPPTTPTLTPDVASSTAGAAVSFAAAATDTWSAVAYDWDFGDGTTAAGSPTSHAFASPGTYNVRVLATDAAGNQSSWTQAFDVTARPSLARPVAGKTVNLEPVSGVITVKVPGSNAFVPLVTPTQVQNGSIIDARKGRVRITIDNGRGGLDTAEFYEGIFKLAQPKVKAGRTWFANLYLFSGSFKGCRRAPRNPRIAVFSDKKNNSSTRSVRHLWGSGEGAFRTVGRFSSATIRGTTWLTDDRCNGTLTKVTVGRVGVRDFVLRKTIVVKARKSYLAKPKKK